MTGAQRRVTLVRMTLKRILRPAAFVLIGLAVGVVGTAAAYPSAPKYEKLPTCVEEDGNTDGKPCWWTDPDTGTRYYVTSENYRVIA